MECPVCRGNGVYLHVDHNHNTRNRACPLCCRHPKWQVSDHEIGCAVCRYEARHVPWVAYKGYTPVPGVTYTVLLKLKRTRTPFMADETHGMEIAITKGIFSQTPHGMKLLHDGTHGVIEINDSTFLAVMRNL